jgi:hypothetical protein
MCCLDILIFLKKSYLFLKNLVNSIFLKLSKGSGN